jgi:hypothetical protein
MAPSLHIVATCSDRKSQPAAIRLRDAVGRSVPERFASWRSAVREAKGQRTIAEDLYQGGYWTIVRDLPAIATEMGWRPKLWVSSAGYGVVSNTKLLVPYSATFATGHADSVTGSSYDDLAMKKWWHCATSGRGALGRSICSIAESDPRSTILVLASPMYLNAMAKDLAASTAQFRSRGALFIVSSKIPASEPGLEECWVPSRATLQTALGGALVSLHARAARHLLRAVSPGDFVKENLSTMSKELEGEAREPKKRSAGSAMSDADVIAFIRTHLVGNPKASHTGLLRQLRDSGKACEQGRFRRLFKQLKPAR